MTTTLNVAVDARIAFVNAVELRRAEQRPLRRGDRVEARLRHGLRERRRERRERLAHRRRRGRRDVAAAGRRRLRAAEAAPVEEEELDVLAPAEAPVVAGRRTVRRRRVVEERLHAGAVDRDAVLGAGVVVDELVVVPAAVDTGRCPQASQRFEREAEPVLLPLLRDGARDRRAADLGVGVDRVAEVDVEVVSRARHRTVGLEAVECRLAVRSRRGVGVAADREAHGGGRGGRRARSRSDRSGSSRGPGRSGSGTSFPAAGRPRFAAR